MRYKFDNPGTKAPIRPVTIPKVEAEYKPERITTKTVLASVDEASEQLKKVGINRHPGTIRRYCRSGMWLEHYHWIRVGGQYLVNVEGVHKTLINP